MDLRIVFLTLLRLGLPVLGGAGVFLAAVFVLMKKLSPDKRPGIGKAAIGVLLACWLILVFVLTTGSRGANYSGNVNLHLFSDYKEAWLKWSLTEYQLILFNMLMFAPFGFLLPLLWKKAEKTAVMALFSFLATLFVEVLQLITGRGIFELDDLFNNFVGSMLGYFLIMAILGCIRKKGIAILPILRALLIPSLLCIATGIAVLAYEAMPYGQTALLPAVNQDMSILDIHVNTELSNERGTASIYRNVYSNDMDRLQATLRSVSEVTGCSFNGRVFREGNGRKAVGEDPSGLSVQLDYDVLTGGWNYTNWSDPVSLTNAQAGEIGNRYTHVLREKGILPEEAEVVFQNGDTLRWNYDMPENVAEATDDFISGSVMVKLDDRFSAAGIDSYLTYNAFMGTQSIISPQEALECVYNGQFEQYVPFREGDQLVIEACSLSYLYDTKGYYRPVYQFSGYVNTNADPWTCQISAIAA